MNSIHSFLGVLSAALVASLAWGCSESDAESPAQQETGALTLHCGSSALHAAAHSVCDAMDAKAVGEGDAHCKCMMGYAWNGSECVGLGDCSCEGADCDKLTSTIEECQQKHASCGAPPVSFKCGSTSLYSSTHSLCGAMDATAVGDNGSHCNCLIGYAWNGSECVMLGDCACEGDDCNKLTSTKEECQQKHAACTTPVDSFHCGSAELHAKSHDTCGAMDAAAVGENESHCNCFLGYAWNGTACEMLGDCACEGNDCNKLTSTIEECQQKHATCGESPYHCGVTSFPFQA